METNNIKIFRGMDKNGKPFTAVCLLTYEQCEELSEKLSYNRLNLTNYNIIYKQLGHNLDKKIINDIKEYCNKKLLFNFDI